MDSIQLPSPIPSDGNFAMPFTASYSLAGSLPGTTQSSGASHSIGAQQRQMGWASSSAESSWSNSNAGNAFIPASQYHHLLAKFNESQRENAALLTRNASLESQYETLMIAYKMLLTHIPATSDQRAALRREDYPNVRFWTRQDWNSASQVSALEVDEEGELFHELDEEDESKEPSPAPGPACTRGKRRAAQGINVAMKYVELEDGTVIDGFRAAEIRRYARSLWAQMALANKLPAVWSDADAASLATYSGSMAERFMELRFCASDWKANLIATDNYPSWRNNWLKRKTKEGKRPADSHVEEANAPAIKKPKVQLNVGNELLAQPSPRIPEEQPEGGLFNKVPPPMINVIPGTPLKPQPVPAPDPSQERYCLSIPQPYDLNFTIGNPLALTSNTPPPTSFHQHQPVAPVLYRDSAPSGDVSTSTAANAPSTLVLPSMATANDGQKRLKGTRMRPTKSTTARNLCALEWTKNNPQGTTDEFKPYYANLSEEQKKFWEDKSKAASQNK